MAIKWGTWSNGQSGSKSRLGIERTSSNTASQTTVTIKVWVEFSGYYANSTSTLTLSGGHSATHSVNLNFSGSGTRGPWTFTQTFTRPYGSASSRSTQISLSGFAGGSPTISDGYTIPRRLYSAPATPTSAIATYTGDGKASMSWSIPTSTGAPATQTRVVRQRNDEAYGSPSYYNGASGTVSYGNLGRGSRYRWSVRGSNVDALGDPLATNWVYMRPLDVSNVVATRSGNDITITWVDLNAVTYAAFEVYDNGTYIGMRGSGNNTFTHTAPNPAQTHRYSVRAYYGNLYAAHVYSNTVQLLSAPLAPTGLSPDGGHVLAGSTLAVSWTHNSVDGSGQERREVQARRAGTTTWTLYTGSTATSQSIPVGTHAEHGEEIEWRVRTKGDHANFGPWSDVASVGVASRPTVAFTSPASGATISAASVDVVFTISRTPASYTLEVRQGTTTVQTIEDYALSSPVTQRISGLRDGVSYSLRLSAFERVSSTVVSRTISVAYPQPEPPTISGEWDPAHGAVHLTAQRTAGTVATTSIRIERRNGMDWETVETLTVSTAAVTLVDNHANLSDATYRAISLATIGADTVESAPTELTLGPIPEQADFLTFRDQVVRIRYAPGISRSPSASDLQLIDLDDSTPDPVAIFGPKERHVTAVSGMLIDEPGSLAREQAALVRELAAWKDLVLLRTLDAPPVWGVVSGVSQPRELWGGYHVSLTHTKAR